LQKEVMGLLFSSIIFLGIILSGFVIIMFRINDNKLRLLLAFGGAFILAITFLEIIPEIYKSTATNYAGFFMLIGFLIQLFVDFLTKGADHGHKHEHVKEKNSINISSLPLLIGVCIHSFFEALPLSDLFENLEVKWALVLGILIHNIPISFVLIGLFLNSGYSKIKSLGLLLVFAFAAPIGIMVSSQIGLFIETDISLLYTITMSIVVGIFLHISTTVLFETSENHRFNFYKIISILLGIVAAFLIIRGFE
jgi:zinc and cadmium transporter